MPLVSANALRKNMTKLTGQEKKEKISCFSGYYDVPPKSPSNISALISAAPPSPENCSWMIRATSDSLIKVQKTSSFKWRGDNFVIWFMLQRLHHVFLCFIFLQILIFKWCIVYLFVYCQFLHYNIIIRAWKLLVNSLMQAHDWKWGLVNNRFKIYLLN